MIDRLERIPFVILLLCCAAAAPPPGPAGVSLSDAWFAKKPGRPLAGFFTVTNDGDQPLLMTGWQSPDCRAVRFADASSASTETPIDTLTVAARDKMVFARGGYHLTCDGPPADIDTIKSIPVTVRFRSGRTLTVPFEIRTINDAPAADRGQVARQAAD